MLRAGAPNLARNGQRAIQWTAPPRGNRSIRPPSDFWSLGRANGCSCGDSTRGHDFLVHFNETAQRIGGASRTIERDPQGIDLVETPLGRYWTVKNDRFLNFTLAEEAIDIYGQRDEGPRRGDVVLDCGANIGVFTRKALSAGVRLVVAIEPTPISIECLRRNFPREIADGRVIVYPKGVWNRVDTLELATEGEGNSVGNSVIFGRDLKNKIQVPLTTIDLLTAELHLVSTGSTSSRWTSRVRKSRP